MVSSLKSEFPIFTKYPDLVYLDSAATTQKPQRVIDRIHTFYSEENANIHRGVYELSSKATDHFEEARKTIARFLGAEATSIAFTSGTTESINIMGRSWLRKQLTPKSNIVTTIMEHHANFIPWQVVAQEIGAELRIIPLTEEGELKLDVLEDLLDENTSLLAINHISNTLGTINPVKEIAEIAHSKHIPVLLDAAQSASLYDLDQRTLGYDFLMFSGHKTFGPTGVGILYVSPNYIDQIQPYNYGGGIIQEVTVKSTSFTRYPYHLDAGTPHIAGVLGLAEAIEFIRSLDRPSLISHIHEITEHAVQKMHAIGGIDIMGSPTHRSGIISFRIPGAHPHDIASFLNQDHIAVRAGMHCTQPLMDSLGGEGSVRASFSIYNTKEDVDKLIKSLTETKDILV